MKVKLNIEMVKKYWFNLGGDMSETMGIAVDHFGNPLTYAEFLQRGGSIKPIHVLSLEDEFLVINHDNPLPQKEYTHFSHFFSVLE
jgi:hypothetical protein